MEEVWIRVVGLSLHLWSQELLKMIGDNCEGYMAINKGTTLRTKVSWARILVKNVEMTKPSVINILEGARSFKVQIWWELLPRRVGVFPAKDWKE